MSRWSAVDWFVTVFPFVVLAVFAWAAVRRNRALYRKGYRYE